MGKLRKLQSARDERVAFVPGPKLIAAARDSREKIRLAVAACGGVMVMPSRVKPGADLLCVVAPYGRLCGIEVRSRGDEAKRWVKWIRAYGGVAGFAKSIDDAMALVNEARALP